MSDQGTIAPPAGFTPINLNQAQPTGPQPGQPEQVSIPLTNQPPAQPQTAPAHHVEPQTIQVEGSGPVPGVAGSGGGQQPQVIKIGQPQQAQPEPQVQPPAQQPQVQQIQPTVPQDTPIFAANPQSNWQPQTQQPQTQQAPVPQFAGQPQVPFNQPPQGQVAHFQQQMPGMPAAPKPRTLSSFETTLDDDALDSVEYFPKLADKQLARICFTMFKPDGSARMLSFHKYWANKLKKSFLCPKEEDEQSMQFKALAESEFGAPKHSIMTIVFMYDIFPHNGQVIPRMAMNGQPEIDPTTGAAIPSGRVMIWRISREKVPMIRQIGREYPLREVDLNIQCTEPNFQKFSITNGRQRIIGAYPSLLAQIEAKSKEIWDYEMIKSIPPTLSYQELQQMVMQNRQISGAGFGQPGGAVVDPYAAASQGFPSPAVGQGGPVYVGPQTGIPPQGFGDLIARESQNYVPPTQGS